MCKYLFSLFFDVEVRYEKLRKVNYTNQCHFNTVRLVNVSYSLFAKCICAKLCL